MLDLTVSKYKQIVLIDHRGTKSGGINVTWSFVQPNEEIVFLGRRFLGIEPVLPEKSGFYVTYHSREEIEKVAREHGLEPWTLAKFYRRLGKAVGWLWDHCNRSTYVLYKVVTAIDKVCGGENGE